MTFIKAVLLMCQSAKYENIYEASQPYLKINKKSSDKHG